MYGRIKEICKKKKITISKLEEELKFSQGSVCKWGAISPSVEKVKKVADYLEVDINKLL
ncbi:helix-turn-helix domain-containing protein [Anaerotignum sp. MB30-C6]|uniref:helix-turn-helix domain-containing protein n=1 Tax=Anaerotignum sp. MB30-C6 TaxID=3070814 RepID=UPI0027DE038D|nr:helix-turn-helix domain-containing protein [Anaerotignum sp. MB30-C6]WMI81897.1 helix-turn-helix domain-containing protein [Anaerotignum sp. MB30-C6]